MVSYVNVNVTFFSEQKGVVLLIFIFRVVF